MANDKQITHAKLQEQDVLALRGLRLPQVTLRHLQARGIYCQPAVSIEHQHLSGRYVIRGVESGGAVADFGAYCSFVAVEGKPLNWLQRVDSIAVNGVHAVVVAPAIVRLQMLRVRQTYDVLITQHVLVAIPNSRRPTLKSSILFHGRRGRLEMELCGQDAKCAGSVRPLFLSRSGEPIFVSRIFEESALRITAAVNCIGCRHAHLLQPNAVRTSDEMPPASEGVVL